MAPTLPASPARAAGGDGRLMRLAPLALAGAVWLLGVFPPPARLSPAYLLQLTAAVMAIMIVDISAPGREAPAWRRLSWLLLELGLAFVVVRTQTSLTRASLIYLLPASRALLMFGGAA